MSFSIWSSQFHQSIHINSECKQLCVVNRSYSAVGFWLRFSYIGLFFLAGNRFSSVFSSTTGSHFSLLGCRVNFTTPVTGADPELHFRGPYWKAELMGA